MKKKTAIITCFLAVCMLALLPGVQADAKEPVVVVIDPGHGGEENRGGEVLPHYVEKNLTLQVAQAMKQTLERLKVWRYI
ncbi:MAG: N-acetylmuramoyl-L-alanine amidase [Eisenbergiella sp.]